MSNLVAEDGGTYTCEVSNANAAPNCTTAGGTAIGTAGTISVKSPQANDTGKGLFTAGKICFDVNAGGNNNTTCGTTANRTSMAMNLSNTYTYTFQNVTANKSLQFLLEDAVGAVELIGFSSGSGDLTAIPAGEPAATLTAINEALAKKVSFTAGSTYSITLKFKPSLNQQGQNPTAYGTTGSNPVVVTLRAFYEDNTSVLRLADRMISIKDCACCGVGGVAQSFTAPSGNTYLTHVYPTGTSNALQCWYVKDSQENVPGSCTTNCINSGGAHHYALANSNGACPADWHIPGNAEWQNLATYLATSSNVGRSWWGRSHGSDVNHGFNCSSCDGNDHWLGSGTYQNICWVGSSYQPTQYNGIKSAVRCVEN
jgi:hypothetical protein